MGYGNIAPKTDIGKIVTIFYAILGIPLMLLCLSNIGDIMATSFRFLYWKVCCFVCTRRPKNRGGGVRRSRSRGGTVRSRSTVRSRTMSFRQKTMRLSTRSADSGFALSDMGPSLSHSDTELRYTDEPASHKRGHSLPRFQYSQRSDASSSRPPSQRLPPRGGSLDRRKAAAAAARTPDVDLSELAKAPVFCNKYVVDPKEALGNHVPGITDERQRRQPSPKPPQQGASGRRALSVPKPYLEPPEDVSPSASVREPREMQRRRTQQQNYSPSPRIMSPMGFGHRSKYLDEPEEDIYYDYDDDYVESRSERIKQVPIWLCVLLVFSYIVAGTSLFHYWEGWEYIDAAYFCFITLTTIGFGDFVPAKRKDADEYKKNIAYCSLYLLFGIALLAMSFNLVQEEVIANVKKVAKTLGIIKDDEEDEEDD